VFFFSTLIIWNNWIKLFYYHLIVLKHIVDRITYDKFLFYGDEFCLGIRVLLGWTIKRPFFCVYGSPRTTNHVRATSPFEASFCELRFAGTRRIDWRLTRNINLVTKVKFSDAHCPKSGVDSYFSSIGIRKSFQKPKQFWRNVLQLLTQNRRCQHKLLSVFEHFRPSDTWLETTEKPLRRQWQLLRTSEVYSASTFANDMEAPGNAAPWMEKLMTCQGYFKKWP